MYATKLSVSPSAQTRPRRLGQSVPADEKKMTELGMGAFMAVFRAVISLGA